MPITETPLERYGCSQFRAANFANGPMLGTLRDTTEADGVPSALANSDDLGGIDDEDGLNAPAVGQSVGPFPFRLLSRLRRLEQTSSAYIDFDQNGQFSDDIERVAYGLRLVNGINNFNVQRACFCQTRNDNGQISCQRQ